MSEELLRGGRADAEERALTVATVDSRAAAAADAAAAGHVFADYRGRLDPDTLRRQEADLALFARFLGEVGAVPPGEAPGLGARLPHAAAAWANISHGLVAAFVQWQLQQGYAIGSLNVRLATVRRYCGLAAAAGALSAEAHALIRGVRGYAGRQARAVDAGRQAQQRPTRRGAKKAQARVLTPGQVAALRAQPDTPQGRRDALLLALLLDHGLRVGELVGLTVESVERGQGTLSFYREKVHRRQTHRLSPAALAAATAYLEQDALAEGQLLRGSRKDGSLWGGLSTRAAQARVRLLGAQAGVPDLSPHDLRHTWATRAARARTDPFALRDAGGWSSLAMPSRYVEAAAIANDRVRLDDEG